MFTRLSVALRAAGDVLSLEQLMEVISSCFTTKEGKTPKCALVDHCCDWKRQLTGSGDFEDFEDVEIVPVEETDAELHDSCSRKWRSTSRHRRFFLR